MKKSIAVMLCAGTLATGLATGFVLGKSCSTDIKEPVSKPHEIQFFVDRIEEKKWLVVEVYDKTIDATIMIDIKVEEGYKVKTSEWVYDSIY